jgi:hypothetical protein
MALAHKLTLTLCALFVGTSPTATWAEAEKHPERAPIAELQEIKKFVSVEVQTQGTAEKIGLKSAELTDLTRLAFLNNFPGVALEGSGGPLLDGVERPNQAGFINCEVWTVGEEYIVAYHVDCSAGPYVAPKTLNAVWGHALLGYGPKDQVPDSIRKGLRNLIEKFAVVFFRSRGVVGSAATAK